MCKKKGAFLLQLSGDNCTYVKNHYIKQSVEIMADKNLQQLLLSQQLALISEQTAGSVACNTNVFH